MTGSESLLKPGDCALLLVDFQAGLAFGVESTPRQAVLNNAIALARTKCRSPAKPGGCIPVRTGGTPSGSRRQGKSSAPVTEAKL
jgi:hypothetical protein